MNIKVNFMFFPVAYLKNVLMPILIMFKKITTILCFFLPSLIFRNIIIFLEIWQKTTEGWNIKNRIQQILSK